MDQSRIETRIKPLIGQRQVRTLKLSDIEKMQTEITQEKTARDRAQGSRGGLATSGLATSGLATGGPGVAGRTVSTLKSILAHAIRYDLVQTNPAAYVRRIAGKPRTRRRSSVVLQAPLGGAIRAADRNELNPTGVAVGRLDTSEGHTSTKAKRLLPSQ